MGTAQSQYVDDVNFTSPTERKDRKRNGGLSKKQEGQVARYMERERKGKDKMERRGDKASKAHRNHGVYGNHDAIAIADLMGYLKIVAAHANNLPLTTRDDPGLGRTVSSLTAEQYATKAKAFFPCDVRVIGGTSLKYDDCWEYPNKRVSITKCLPLHNQGEIHIVYLITFNLLSFF